MTRHRLANVALFVLIFAAWAVAMDTDYHADQVAMDAERREWAQAVAHCHRAFGPQTAPEYDHADRLVCVGRKGQRHIEVPIAADDLKVAGK
jgi:hypothetical protein